MLRKGALAIAIAATLGMLSSAALAASFTMTTETSEGLGFIDIDSKQLDGEIGKAVAYTVFKDNSPVPPAVTILNAAKYYSASASQLWFQCTTKHYSVVQLFFYDDDGRFIGSYDKPVLVDQPVPPQTGVEEQFNYVCNGAAPKNRINEFPSNETPLQTLIRASRKTMSDPRWKP